MIGFDLREREKERAGKQESCQRELVKKKLF